jgi:hypothetical protein
MGKYMNKAVMINAIILFSLFVEFSYAAPVVKKRGYVFPKRIQHDKITQSEESFDEVTTFPDADDEEFVATPEIQLDLTL